MMASRSISSTSSNGLELGMPSSRLRRPSRRGGEEGLAFLEEHEGVVGVGRAEVGHALGCEVDELDEQLRHLGDDLVGAVHVAGQGHGADGVAAQVDLVLDLGGAGVALEGVVEGVGGELAVGLDQLGDAIEEVAPARGVPMVRATRSAAGRWYWRSP